MSEDVRVIELLQSTAAAQSDADTTDTTTTAAAAAAAVGSDYPGGRFQHVAMMWQPPPLTVVVDVEPDDDWRIALREEAADVFMDEAQLVRPWEVRFDIHDGSYNEPCPACDRLYDQQRASVIALTGEPSDPYAVPKTRFVPGFSRPAEYHAIPSTRWSRPSGQLTLHTSKLLVASVVEAGRSTPRKSGWDRSTTTRAVSHSRSPRRSPSRTCSSRRTGCRSQSRGRTRRGHEQPRHQRRHQRRPRRRPRPGI